MMALPTLIVILIMGSTIIHLAGETLVSSLSTATLSLIPEWPPPARKSSSPPPDFFSPNSKVIPPPVVSVPEPEFIPQLRSIPKLADEVIVTPKRLIDTRSALPANEAKAREKVISHLGGESVYCALEDDMSEAFSAARNSLESRGICINDLDILAIADLTKPSYVRRLTLFHPGTGEETRHLVAHGTRTGKLYATKFSNRSGSRQTSPGLYQIGAQYNGSHGSSLRLHGLDEGVNDLAFRRAIVLHSAWYVSYNAMVKNLQKEGVPRIGCSHGCPAVDINDLDLILEYLVPGSYLYIYTKM